MSLHIYGRLHEVIEETRIISIRVGRNIQYFYLAKGMFTTFMPYFVAGTYAFITVSDEKRLFHGFGVRTIESIEKLMYPNGQTPKVYYDVTLIKSSIRRLVNTDKTLLFLDLEMSMPPFRQYQNFVSEIIQYGICITESQGKVLETFTSFVKPTLTPSLSDRTLKFLKIKQSDVESGISFREFHQLVLRLLRTYRPMVVVWGQNDVIELKNASRNNRLPDLASGIQLVDLLKLQKNYFGLKNDLGLFNALAAYESREAEKQIHDAMEDAFVTNQVFHFFKAYCNGTRDVDVSQFK